MGAIRIDRLHLHLKGIDAASGQTAAQALPQALARQLPTPQARSNNGPLRFSATPSAPALTERLAQHLAAQLQARRRGPG